MTEITLRPVGGSLGVELPSDVVARLDLKPGDKLIVSQTEDGALRLVPTEAGRDEQLRLAREGMRNYREALRELAK